MTWPLMDALTARLVRLDPGVPAEYRLGMRLVAALSYLWARADRGRSDRG